MVQTAAMDMLLIEPHPGWVRITLNRPEARNALNTATLAALAAALARIDADAALHAVLITGAGGNFAAGADIAEIETKTGRRRRHRSAQGALGGDPRLCQADDRGGGRLCAGRRI